MTRTRKETDVKVISINDAPSRSEQVQMEWSEKRKKDLLDILNEMKVRIESGEIQEFVATSLGNDGQAQIHALVDDVAVGVGLFEIGKNILINQYNE